MISQSWRRNWPRGVPFFAYPPEIRKVLYTNNAIESITSADRQLLQARHSQAQKNRSAASSLGRFVAERWRMPI
jgi:putative transposase